MAFYKFHKDKQVRDDVIATVKEEFKDYHLILNQFLLGKINIRMNEEFDTFHSKLDEFLHHLMSFKVVDKEVGDLSFMVSPPLFVHFDEIVEDILSRDMSEKFTLLVVTVDDGVRLSSMTPIAIRECSYISSTMLALSPSMKAIFSLEVPSCGAKLEMQYLHQHATLMASLNQAPSVNLTESIGTPAIAFGVEGGYDMTT
ncbi:hypothetical protein PTKIN_Ptkin14bG0036000 [Pterospermum kingtungense]